MLEKLTIESFEPLINTSFWAYPKADTRVELRLVSAQKVMESEAARLPRNPFSLYFFGPASFRLEQATYAIKHDAFPEPLPIFLVPVGSENEGYLYEAVFT
jgi:hypothetical protein